ncbi:site-specific integrase [Thiohalorhabdus denitrificans]
MVAFLEDTAGERDPKRDNLCLRHLYPAFSGRDLHGLTSAEIRRYARQRQRAGAAASTVNKEIGLLSKAINHARLEWGWELPNPTSGCRLPEPEGRLRWLTKAEAARLIEAAGRTRAPHLADLIRLGLYTGMRRGELFRLEWRRVDLQQGLVFLDPGHQKNRRRGSVPLNATARAALVSRRQWVAEHCPDSPWVFAKKDGEPLGDVKNGFASACKAAGIVDFRIHDLRHTFASWLVMSGVPLYEVRDLLRHRSITQTERYAHLAPDRLAAAAAVLDGEPAAGDTGAAPAEVVALAQN